MGFFAKFFGKKETTQDNAIQDSESTKESPVVLASTDASMDAAFEQARNTFKYFWREISWEQRRIIPAHGLACVKVPFSQQLEKGKDPYVEQMWINDIYFDGERVFGVLLNQPNALTNINQGDQVEVDLSEISDWMLSIVGKVYGGFTVQLLRTAMEESERKAHDDAWGLDFGDPNDIEIVYQQKEHPENLIEHPMSVNMKEQLVEFLEKNPDEIHVKDELGQTMLHREAIAGNRSSIEALIECGAELSVTTNQGETALDFAKRLDWEHIIPLLEAK